MQPAVDQDQTAVFAFLGDPRTHGLNEPVIRVDTHGAAVFLAGPDVYKVKRAVCFPFMDFSTIEKRRRACENEIAVNRRNAPGLYLGALPISRDGGRLKLGEGERIVEWAVHLRRFDENRTLDRLAQRGDLGAEILGKVADVVAQSHERALIVKNSRSTASLKGLLQETAKALAAATDTFPAGPAAALGDQLARTFDRVSTLLEDREALGWARRCHGDLHLRNIVLIDAVPVLFDAIEFDDSIATCDILYDLAFLLMDLWTRGLRAGANLVFNRYLAQNPDEDGQLAALAALPLFLALRAAIRAKVILLEPGKDAGQIEEARRYFDAAVAFIAPRPPDFVAIGGLSGSGKSTLARALAPAVGRAPGALHLRSDVERKRLFGVGELERLPDEAYTPDASAKTYERLWRKSALALAAGQSVVLDAVNLEPDERAAANRIAREAQARFTGLWLTAPVDKLIARVARRTGDASDATAAVVEAQTKGETGPIDWLRLDASGPTEPVLEKALAAIEAHSSGPS